MEDHEWQTLLDAAQEIQEWFPDGIVFIGEIAVYAHVMSIQDLAAYSAKSHYADFMIMLSEYVDLRDVEMLVPNRRLSKQQFVKKGFEFDVYVEGQTDLAVPVAEAVCASEMRSGLRVACCEHLLVLKAKAMRDRKGSVKGDKDEDDVMRILLAAGPVDRSRLARLTDVMLADLSAAVEGDAPIRLAEGNLHVARSLRERARAKMREIEDVHAQNYSVAPGPM